MPPHTKLFQIFTMQKLSTFLPHMLRVHRATGTVGDSVQRLWISGNRDGSWTGWSGFCQDDDDLSKTSGVAGHDRRDNGASSRGGCRDAFRRWVREATRIFHVSSDRYLAPRWTTVHTSTPGVSSVDVLIRVLTAIRSLKHRWVHPQGNEPLHHRSSGRKSFCHSNGV